MVEDNRLEQFVEESFALDVIESGGEAETPRKKEKERNAYDKGKEENRKDC